MKQKKGISLFELIATIVIIGILGSIGGLAVVNVVNKSKESTAENQTFEIYSASKNYFHNENIDNGTVQMDTLLTGTYLDTALYNQNKSISITKENDKYSIQDETGEVNIVKIGNYYVLFKNEVFKAYSSLETAKENA